MRAVGKKIKKEGEGELKGKSQEGMGQTKKNEVRDLEKKVRDKEGRRKGR